MDTLDLKTCVEQPPRPVDRVWPAFPLATVGVLAGPTGAGKSTLALEAAMAVATGEAAADLAVFKPLRAGRVAYLAAKDSGDVLARRIHLACAQVDSQAARRAIVTNLAVLISAGRAFDITGDADLRRLTEVCANARLVVLDPLAGFQRRERDDDECEYAVRVSQALAYLAVNTGAAVLCVDRGECCSGVGDSAAWRARLAPVSDMTARQLVNTPNTPVHSGPVHYVQLDIDGNGYGPPPPPRLFCRHEGGILRPVLPPQGLPPTKVVL